MQIPESLFLSFQSQLQAEGKRLCRDLAKVLGVPEKELITNVLLKDKKISITPDTNDGKPFCPVLVPRGAILDRCFHPILLGTERCMHHQSVGALPEVPDGLTTLVKLSTTTPYYMNPETKEVLDESGKLVGVYRDEEVLLF